MSRRTFLVWLLVILATATTLRDALAARRSAAVSVTGVGIVWHDEGAWTHNARNRALWGVWRTDDWNPVYVAPVFTALEYVAFRDFGVGTWQARWCRWSRGSSRSPFSMAGLAAVAGRRAALIGGALLATNYAFVMWNRAALMESTMTAFIVVGWAAYALAERRPAWGVVAGVAAVAGVVHESGGGVLRRGDRARCADDDRPLAGAGVAGASRGRRTARTETRAAVVTLAASRWPRSRSSRCSSGRTGRSTASTTGRCRVMRKPDYDLRHFVDRASWLPIVQAIFMRMWLVVAGAALGDAGHRRRGGERRGRPSGCWCCWVLRRVARTRRARLGQRTPLRDVHPGDGRARRHWSRAVGRPMPSAIGWRRSAERACWRCPCCCSSDTW